MAVTDLYFERLGQSRDTGAKLVYIGLILTIYTQTDIQEKIALHSDGWNGDIGKGCQIMARILTQI